MVIASMLRQRHVPALFMAAFALALCADKKRNPLQCDALLQEKHKTIIKLPDRNLAPTHIIYGSLLKKDLIESIELYKKDDENHVVVARVDLGRNLDGHPGVVHGGIIALLIDETLGFGFFSMGVPFAYTANLSINYMAPVAAGSTILVEVKLDRQENRKLFWTASVLSPDRETTYCNATSLFIIPREHHDTSK